MPESQWRSHPDAMKTIAETIFDDKARQEYEAVKQGHYSIRVLNDTKKLAEKYGVI